MAQRPWPATNRSLCSAPISVGAHFNGLGSVVQSLLAQGIDHTHEFVRDINEARKTFIATNIAPKILDDDVLAKRFSQTPKAIDLYAARSPCPPFFGG